MIKESELDDDQIKVLMETLDKSCIVAGCAGSGKSVLALIKAKRIQKEYGNNYKIIVFTKALCNYMSSGKQELELTNDFYYYKEWKYQRERKGRYMVYSRDKNGNMIPYMPSADYIIVDEIQDFSDVEIKEFLNATHKNFFFFGDTAQSIFQGLKKTLPVDKISSIVPLNMKVKNWELYRNHRLPLPVARVVQPVGVDLPPFIESTYKSKDTTIPRFLKYSDEAAQIKAATRGGSYMPVSWNPIGNKLTYRPFDRDYYINKLNAEAGATRRALANQSGGNSGRAMAGILAADYNAQDRLGDLFRKSEEYNLEQRQKVEDFNRATNQANSQGELQADMANQQAYASARDYALRGTMAAAEMRQKARMAAEAARSANLSGFLSALGDIGYENKGMNMVRQLYATGALGPMSRAQAEGFNLIKSKPKKKKSKSLTRK